MKDEKITTAKTGEEWEKRQKQQEEQKQEQAENEREGKEQGQAEKQSREEKQPIVRPPVKRSTAVGARAKGIAFRRRSWGSFREVGGRFFDEKSIQ